MGRLWGSDDTDEEVVGMVGRLVGYREAAGVVDRLVGLLGGSGRGCWWRYGEAGRVEGRLVEVWESWLS